MADNPPFLAVVAACRRSFAAPSPRGRPDASGLAAVCRALAGSPDIGRVLVVTDDKGLARSLARGGADAIHAAAPSGAAAPLPPGALEGARTLLSRGQPPDAPCIVLGVDTARALAGEVGVLAGRWREATGKVLASIAPPEDHPCQLQQYYAVEGVGFAHFFEAGNAAACWREKGFYVSRKLPRLPFLAAAAPDFPEGSAAGEGPGVITDGEAMRVLFPRREIDALLAGLGFPGPVRPVGCSFFQSGAALRALFFAGGDGWRVGLAGRREQALVVSLDPGQEGGAALPLALKPGGWARCPTFTAQAGIFYSLLRESRDGRYDIALDLPAPGAPWQRAGFDLVAKATGKMIYGRQNYPECWRIDGRFVLGGLADIVRFPELLAGGRVLGLRHPADAGTP